MGADGVWPAWRRLRGMAVPIIVGVAVLALVGCKANPSVEVYVSDIDKLMSDGKPMTTAAKMDFDVLSKNACDRDGAKMLNILKNHFEDAKEIQCSEDRRGPYAQARFEFKMPLIATAGNNGTVANGNAMFIGAGRRPDGDIGLVAGVVADDVKRLAGEVSREFLHDIGKGGIETYTITVINDTRSKRTIGGYATYVNGKPRPTSWQVDLAPRDKVELRLSNVYIDAMSISGTAELAAILSKP